MAAEPKRLLVLNIDVDNDLYEKAKVQGPVIGKKANSEAATKLALADPTDSDSNAMFETVRTADELGKEYVVECATLTGDKRLGYYASREVIRQLEYVIEKFKPDSCVLISDGASDEQMLPLIQTRVKIDNIKQVTVKQAKELENTYFTILDKLKDPQIAKIVFGIPGLALILFAISEFLGLRVFIGILGAYFIIKAIGLEDRIFKWLHEFEVSFNKASFIFYFASIPLAAVSVWLGFSRLVSMQLAGETNIAKLAAGFEKDLLLLLVPAILLLLIGKFIEALNEKRNYVLPQYITYSSTLVLLWLLFTNAADWVLGNISFGDFFSSLILVIVLMLLLLYLAREFKASIVSKMKLEGKTVYTQIGGQIGKAVGVNRRKGTMIISTNNNQKFDIPLENIASLDDKVIVKD